MCLHVYGIFSSFSTVFRHSSRNNDYAEYFGIFSQSIRRSHWMWRNFMFWMCISLFVLNNLKMNLKIVPCWASTKPSLAHPRMQSFCVVLAMFLVFIRSIKIFKFSIHWWIAWSFEELQHFLLKTVKRWSSPFSKLYTFWMWSGSSGLCDTKFQINSVSKSGLLFYFLLIFGW